MQQQPLHIGLVGSGFMGRCHAHAFRSVSGLFDLAYQPVLDYLAERDRTLAKSAAQALGFARWTDDWQQLTNDPKLGLIAITAPNALHKPIALAAIAAGKPVYCEKPLANTSVDAEEMTLAAEQAGLATFVGFNYLKNPITALARDVINSGEIGEVIGFRGVHAEDYMCDPNSPYSFRHEPIGGGVMADLGSHIVAMARFLIGPISAVTATTHTVYKHRPAAAGSTEMRAVEVDEQTRALVRFDSGIEGSIEANWCASGRKMQLTYEITGTRGSIAFSQERMNELRIYEANQQSAREGFKTIEAGPAHEPYGAFCPAPGHQLGFNDQKIIEVRDLLMALAGEKKPSPDFREAWEVQKVIDATLNSARQQCWVDIDAGPVNG